MDTTDVPLPGNPDYQTLKAPISISQEGGGGGGWQQRGGGGGGGGGKGGGICSQLQPSALDNLPPDQQVCSPPGQQPSTAWQASTATSIITLAPNHYQ